MPELAASPAPALPPRCVLCGGGEGDALFVKRGWTFVRCTGCGLVSIHPRPSPAAIAQHHEGSYRDGAYAAFAEAEAVRAAIAQHRLALIHPLAVPGPWLDVGCSTGAFVAAAAAEGLVAEGLELSEAAAARARARGLVVHTGTAEHFAPSRRYAVLTAFDVVEHLLDPVAFVERVSQWLRPGGVLALTVPDVGSLPARLMGRHWYYYAPPDHVHYFSAPTIRQLLERPGLADIAVRRAWKPITLDWATAAAALLSPRAAPLAHALRTVVPRRLRSRAWPLPLGELLVTARRPG